MKKKLNKVLMFLLTTCMVLGIMPAVALAGPDICKIIHTNSTETLYDVFDDALIDVLDGETIQLIDNINHTGNISISGKSITFDVNGFTLDATCTSGNALDVGTGGEVNLIDSGSNGAFNVTHPGTSGGNGVYVHGGGKATVTNAYRNGIGGAFTDRCAKVDGAGSELTLLGDAIGGFYAVGAHSGASLTIHGSINGGGAMYVEGAGTTVVIYGNSSGGGTGVLAENGADVYVKGNVTGGGFGVSADGGSQVTVDGFVKALTGSQVYIRTSGVAKMQPDYEPTSSKPDYFEYNNTVGSVTTNVWVKKFSPPLPIAISYIYDGTTEYDTQNAANVSASKLASGDYDATLATAPDPLPTRAGYTFAGWFTQPDGGGIEWAFGAAGVGTVLLNTNNVDIVTQTLTLYANWTATPPTPPPQPVYTVTYAPGLHGTFAPQITGNLSAGAATPTAPNPTGEAGWLFNGWSPAPSTTVTENVTYTAQWISESSPTAAPPSAERPPTGNSQGGNPPAPKTNDNSNMALWVLLGAASLIVLASIVTIEMRRKKHAEKI